MSKHTYRVTFILEVESDAPLSKIQTELETAMREKMRGALIANTDFDFNDFAIASATVVRVD